MKGDTHLVNWVIRDDGPLGVTTEERVYTLQMVVNGVQYQVGEEVWAADLERAAQLLARKFEFMP